MDFWTRLIGGVSNKKSQQAAASSPQQRLQRFRRAYNPILQLCGRPQTLASHRPALDQLHSSLQRLIALLREEGRAPAPHLCLNFAHSSQIYSVVARAASASRDERLVRQAIALFSLLLESEDEDFVASVAFAKSLMRFALRVIDSNSGMYGEDIEADVIELLFGVVAKIRIQPDILSVWFTTSRPTDDAQKDNKDFAGLTQKDDFPLCYLLIDRIHHDGRIGDFARTGLLYIFEAVSHSTHLEDWIIESDLPTLMASGLGALYSQLSRELSILHHHNRLPMILALSDYVDLQPSSAPESLFSPTHATHMATFLSHLAFWQDVLEHCKSDNVKITLLDHFRILFLQQLLYPSLLQSSDTDGGSSVAVLTYLSNIFESLDHPDLTHMILQYLLAIPETEQPEPISPTANRRKSSLMLLTQSQNDDDKFEPTLFSLVDLVLNGIKSQNAQTAVAALKLSSVMLTRHRKYATSTLLQSKSVLSSQDKRTVNALCSETDHLIQIASDFGGEPDVDEAYATACQDIMVPLEVQMANRTSEDVTVLKLLPHDSYLQSVTELFTSFFTNGVDVNLALTEATVCLASCADVGLDGWLAVCSSDYQTAALEPTFDMIGLDEEEAASLRLLQSMNSQKRQNDSNDPLLSAILQALRDQIINLRSDIPSIDYLIAKRIAILGGAGREDLPVHSKASVETPRPGETRQVQRLQTGAVYKSASRDSSVSRSSTSTRARDSSLSRVPPRSTSLSQVTRGRQSNSIFRPPPPESPDNEHFPGAEESSSIHTEPKENEAQVLRRKIRFIAAESSATNRVFKYAPESASLGQMEIAEGADSREATLSHVVTNIVILQHFVLELAAVMKTRAIVFEEVAFT